MNEWEFTADFASHLNEYLTKNPDLIFSRALCERPKSKGSHERNDLIILDKNQRIVLTGEVKLPYQKDGGSPFNQSVVSNARSKALSAGTKFFFTWNVNEFVLWETTPEKTNWQQQNYRQWTVVNVHKEEHLLMPSTMHEIQFWLATFLTEFDKILRGASPIGTKSPDEKFIEYLEASLQMPILLSIEELSVLYKKSKFKSELDKWMRDEQGWIIYDDPEGIRENHERASKFSCYALVNKLVFYEALLKRYGARMDKISVPEHTDKGEDLRIHLERYFAEARDITGDYETVFGEDHTSFGNRIPFYSDSAVTHWRELINQIHAFDFSKLDYEVIGSIFERLISPEERHKFGQFYTCVEVVDLINSFCIRNGDEKVMDPACGGGTFLVRAYVRKRELSPARNHGVLLSDLYGVDISHFATHLTTINLATRDLIDAENYPQIARSDFFDIGTNRTFLSLPKHLKTKGLGGVQHRDVEIPKLDAVVGNPPYVRQEEIPKAKAKNQHGTKEFYQSLVRSETNINLSGRSDIHCYFWPHATSFLKDDGYLCLLTSSQWLDVEYGFRLQDWMLRNFEIVAVIESIDEPWFVGARVVTAITILRRQMNSENRIKNTIRFVQLRQPVRELLAHEGTTLGAIRAADAFRDEILSLTKNSVNERYRARLVSQKYLWDEGVRLGIMMGKSDPGDDEDSEERISTGEYYGGKWGVYLRAPDLWFELLDKYGSKLTPLGNIAEIRFGVKSGKDSFFFPIDKSDECLNEHQNSADFEENYKIPRKEVASGKIKLVLCGEGRGELRPIEAKYLEPEVHSLMEIDGFTVSSQDCSRYMILVSKRKRELKGEYIRSYIDWGEKQNYQTGATCASRVTKDREWYDLTGHERGSLFWPKSQQYKHAIPVNENNLQCNCNLYDVHLPKGIEPEVMGAILNSTLVILSKFQYGRPVGVEGNLKTEVVDVNMMLIPNPEIASPGQRSRLKQAFRELKKRKAMQLLSEKRMRRMAYIQAGKEEELEQLSDICELDMKDRRELDDAVLEMLGISSKQERTQLIDELNDYLRHYFELTRQKEEKAIVNKNKARRKGQTSPSEIAVQIYDEITKNEPSLLQQYDPNFIDKTKPFDTFELPSEGVPSLYNDIFQAHGVIFKKGKSTIGKIESKIPEQDELIILLAESGVRSLVRVPHEDKECVRIKKDFQNFVTRRAKRIKELIEERTSDEKMQDEIYEAIFPLLSRN